MRALNGRVEAFHGQRVGAGDQQEIGIGQRLARGAELLRHLRRRHDRLVVVVAAALGKRLVLQVERGHPGPLELAHRATDVQRVAVAGVGVGDDRHARLLDDVGEPVDDLARREQAEVGIAHAARDPPAGGVERGEARARGQTR